MTLLAPWALVGSAAILLVILLHLLRTRRRPVVVSSNLLWDKALDELMARSPFRKLLTSLLLLLQILIATALVLGLVRPAFLGAAARGSTRIVLVDVSASMEATDVTPSRLAAARTRVEDLVRGMASGERLGLVTFDSRAMLLCPPTSNRRSLLARTGEIVAGNGPTRIDDALALARGLLDTENGGEILVISDGAFPAASLSSDSTGKPEPGPLPRVLFLGVGRSDANVGIERLSVRPSPVSGRTEQALVAVRNGGSAPANASLELLLDGALARSKELSLGAGESRSLLFDIEPGEDSTLEARLVPRGVDHLQKDDRATLRLEGRGHRILLVSEGNTFVEKALLSLPDMELVRLLPGDYPGGAERLGDFKVVVHDYSGPSADPLPEGGHLFLCAQPPGNDVVLGEDVERPVILDQDVDHPVTRFLSLDDLLVTRMRRMVAAPGTETLVSTDKGPLVVAFENPRGRRIVVGADLEQSNWPLRLSFPLFLANATSWLEGGGTERSTSPAHGETNIRPHDRLDLASGSVDRIDDERLVTRAEIWRPVALMALALLLLEWAVFHRRVTA
jgi:hypothetical protein